MLRQHLPTLVVVVVALSASGLIAAVRGQDPSSGRSLSHEGYRPQFPTPQLRDPKRQPQQLPTQQTQPTQQQQQQSPTPPPSTPNNDVTSGDCGTPLTLLTRIIGGTAAAGGAYPWQAAVQRGDGSFCGGVIIDARHVLTAAHCTVSGATYTVGVGSNDLQAALTPGVGVQAVTVHPNFQRATLENDIAILTLSKALTLNDPAVGVARVCLPQAGADVTRFATCHVTGWGATSIQQLATTRWLQTVSVDIQTDQTCSSLYAMTFQSNRFCAGDTVNGSRDSCLGDSGGPLVCSEAGRYVLYGLVSSGVSCANPRFPGIYTEVAAFVPWILQNI
ncbi:trypsin-like isoform X2 [Pomacea canaliculata]|uniref:trypsin-like isoform X2 n=1 Tax=Pomacea canaliculata TaxID=400727 RepID=UPI000D73C4DD|nr:trypsin-like isoform X2 [Pomacea canaliculata]